MGSRSESPAPRRRGPTAAAAGALSACAYGIAFGALQVTVSRVAPGLPELAPQAIVISGDVSQRGRHGEFQRAVAFVEAVDRSAPTLCWHPG